MSGKIKGILFDLDGTLLDTAKDLTYALNLSLTKHGFTNVEESLVKASVSKGSLAITKQAIPNQLPSVQLLVQQDMLGFYQQVSGHKTILFDGIPALICQLESLGCSMGIITNKVAKFARPLIRQFTEFDSFKAIISGDSTTHNKPSSQPMLLAAQQLEIESREIIYIGDAVTDIIAAQNAGMSSAIASWGYLQSNDNINEWNADHILKKPSDLTTLVNL